MYQLNDKNQAVIKFKAFYWEVTKKEVHRFLKEEEKEVKSKKEKIKLTA